MSSVKVLYEDNHIIAVVKPAGVLTQGDNSGEESLMDMVKDYLKEKYKKPGNVFLGLVHRLDRPVSGIILFAKTSKGASRLSEQFRNHKIEKIYQAIVIGIPEKKKGTLINYLSKDEKTLKAKNSGDPFSAVSAGKPASAQGFGEAKEAILHYEVVKSDKSLSGILTDPSQSRKTSLVGYSLLKIKLETGKFHQIRAQLSLAGFPILGDVKYGAPNSLPDKSIALSAVKITFQTATTDKIIELEIPLPDNWKEYIK
jgi:23S rRNA pseudouridine1911/1915/1917 synthase